MYSTFSKIENGNFSNMVDSDAKTFTEILTKQWIKENLCKLSHKWRNTKTTNLVSCYYHTPLPTCKPHASPEEPAKTDLPLLPGGATILCHFWNSVVLRQSRGLSAYALWRDISSCIGSRITHSCTRKVELALSQYTASLSPCVHYDFCWVRREEQWSRSCRRKHISELEHVYFY